MGGIAHDGFLAELRVQTNSLPKTMKINPSSLNLDFNKEFCQLYSIFRSLEELSLKYNIERKAKPKAPPSPEAGVKEHL